MLSNYLISSFFVLLFAYVVFRVFFRKDYKNRRKLSTMSTVMGILVFACHANLLYFTIPSRWPDLPPITDNQFLKIIGSVLIGMGAMVVLISWLRLGTNTSLGMDKNKLEAGGIYKYTRNPQVAGYGLVLFSFVIMYFSWLVLLWFLLYIIISGLMIKTEEEFLNQKYKEEYRDYCRKVPRII